MLKERLSITCRCWSFWNRIRRRHGHLASFRSTFKLLSMLYMLCAIVPNPRPESLNRLLLGLRIDVNCRSFAGDPKHLVGPDAGCSRSGWKWPDRAASLSTAQYPRHSSSVSFVKKIKKVLVAIGASENHLPFWCIHLRGATWPDSAQAAEATCSHGLPCFVDTIHKPHDY